MKTKIEMKKHININIGDIVEYTTFLSGKNIIFGIVEAVLFVEKSIIKSEENKRLYVIVTLNKNRELERHKVMEEDIKEVYKKEK